MANDFRTQFKDTADGFTLVMPSRFNKAAGTGIIINVLVLVFYGISIMPNLARTGVSRELVLFINIFFLAAFSGFGAYNLFLALWAYFGRETLVIGREACALSKTVFGVGVKRRFTPAQAASIAAVGPTAADIMKKSLLKSMGVGFGKMSFVLGKKTRYFGAALDDAEVAAVLQRLAR